MPWLVLLLPLLGLLAAVVRGEDATAARRAVDWVDAGAKPSRSEFDADGGIVGVGDDEKNRFHEILRSRTEETTFRLNKLSDDYRGLQERFDSGVRTIERMRDSIESEFGGLRQILGWDEGENSSNLLDRVHDDIEAASSKATELTRRTEAVLARVGEYNRMVLGGKPAGGSVSSNVVKGGLVERLQTVLAQEMERRDRYEAAVARRAEEINEEYEAGHSAEPKVAFTDDDASIEANITSPHSPYITRSELEEVLSYENVVYPSEKNIQESLLSMAQQLMEQHILTDDAMWKSRMANITPRYEKQFEELERRLEESIRANKCLAIPEAVQIVGRALEEHRRDGTGLFDHARYENGGSIVHELTSAPFIPPPRNDPMAVGIGGAGTRVVFEREKQRMFDEQTEDAYSERQSTSYFEGLNLWKWYASFKFESLRQYLPDDWERLLDNMSEYVGKGSWSDFTPRGAIDALVPDYVFQALGLNNLPGFGTLFGRTVSPEIVISADGQTARPLGRCYPLSMHAEDDPALSLLSRHTHMEGGMEVTDEDVDSSILVGPKFTVRLPYPVRIDAVTLEHRSFPISQRMLESGWRGGESAPRWVRVVGFPPCPEYDLEAGFMQDEDECGVRGFDVSHPIDLGSFEYRRITVTGREDDYGGSEDEEENSEASSSGRPRSVQTFAVRGAERRPMSLLEDILDDAAYDSTQCSSDSPSCQALPKDESMKLPESDPEEALPVGQCAPPKDEDSLPSCGADVGTASTTPSSQGGSSSESDDARHIVEAVSFIIEENWGNGEFTCLYRVRVHGDAVLE